MNEVFQEFEEIEQLEGFWGFEGFEGGLNTDLWLRLIIEDVIIHMKYSTKETTALNVALEVLTEENLPGKFSIDDLLEACDCYLKAYSDVFADVGYVPYDFFGHVESGKIGLVNAIPIKSKLFKAHVAELDAHVKSMLGDKLLDSTS